MSMAAAEALAPWCATPVQREQVIKEHARIVRHVVGRIAANLPAEVDHEDLLSAGVLGLIKAVDRFDPRRGVKFATYANAVVRGEVLETLRSRDWAPRSLRRRLREVANVIGELQAHLRRPAEDTEIAEAMGMDLDQYQRLLQEASVTMVGSIEELLEHESLAGCAPVDGKAWERPGDPAVEMEKRELRRLVAEAVLRLPERERLVISLYYDDELTLREIGEVLGITQSRVCQIHSQAAARLRAALQRELRF
jgi:RNA polymerase sigma factor FliA